MTDQSRTQKKTRSVKPVTAVLLILPLILLGGVIAIFLKNSGALRLALPVPVEDLTFERSVLKPGSIDLHVRNASHQDVTLAQAVVNGAVWPMNVTPSATIPRLSRVTVHLDYPWVEGEAYGITLFTTSSIPFIVDIPVAFTTPQPDKNTFLSFTLIGIFVGIIPVYLGILWFPALRQLGRRWMVFLLAVTAGLLVFLGLDTLAEALDQVRQMPGPFQGIGLVGIGAVATFFLLDAISRRQAGISKSESAQRMSVAYMIATGIGLHNLGEGLAIGAAYSVGEISLGAFLVVGFIIQNITEGLAIISPILRDRPSTGQLALLGLVGGAPAIIGAWIGGFSPSPTLAVFFLAVGTGAILEVVYEIAKLIQKDTSKQPMPMTVFSGILAGMLLLWVTGLLIK
jgi:zinc transporter, ZIP family